MAHSNKNLIHEDTYHLAQCHGLKITISPDTKNGYTFSDLLGTVVTAGWSDADFGAELTDIPANEGSVDDWLHLYCENVLHCTPNDIIWLPFSCDFQENGKTTCNINDLNYGWDSNTEGGIIFITKESAKHYFSAKNLTNDMVKEIEDEFSKQISELQALKQGKVHRILVDVEQENLSGDTDKIRNSCGGIFEMYEVDADDAANEIINNSIQRIESAENAISITFKMNKDLGGYGYLPTYITSQLKDSLSFIPAVSRAHIHSDNTFTISLSLSTIPPFLKLCADTDKDLLASLCMNINSPSKATTFKVISSHEAQKIISKNNGYADWSPLMANALIASLTEHIKDLSLVSTKLVSDKDTPDIQVARFAKHKDDDSVATELMLTIIKSMGDSASFLEKRLQYDNSDRAEGFVGLATTDQKMAFFNENQDIIITYGRSVKSNYGFESFVELIQDGLSKYGYDMDHVSDALNVTSATSGQDSQGRIAVGTWLVSWSVNQLHKELLSFLQQ